jgi:hypothetical protein
MSLAISPNQTSQSVQKTQYSKSTRGFVAGCLVTGAAIGGALAINSFVRTRALIPSESTLDTIAKSLFKGISCSAIGGIISSFITNVTPISEKVAISCLKCNQYAFSNGLGFESVTGPLGIGIIFGTAVASGLLGAASHFSF